MKRSALFQTQSQTLYTQKANYIHNLCNTIVANHRMLDATQLYEFIEFNQLIEIHGAIQDKLNLYRFYAEGYMATQDELKSCYAYLLDNLLKACRPCLDNVAEILFPLPPDEDNTHVNFSA